MNKHINWEKILNCTMIDHNDALLYIEQLLDLKYKFEAEGINGFTSYINSSSNDFEKISLNLIMQGYMPEICSTILYNLLNSSNFKDDVYLKNIIFTEFVLMIQKDQISDVYVKKILLSFLGVEFAAKYYI